MFLEMALFSFARNEFSQISYYVMTLLNKYSQEKWRLWLICDTQLGTQKFEKEYICLHS